jgi:hypothetical protein
MTVAAVMAALLIAMMYGAVLPMLNLSSAGSSKVDTLGPATTALTQLEADIRISTTNGITVGATPATPVPTLGTTAETNAIAIEVPEQFVNINDNYGQMLYDQNSGLSAFRSYVVWALVSEVGGSCDLTHPCDLYRTTWDSGTANPSAAPITSTQLAPILTSIATSGRLMSRNITSLEVANQTIPCAGCFAFARPEVDIEMAAQSRDQMNKTSQTSYQTQVFARNN